MGYKIFKFQNTSGWDEQTPSIVIEENDEGWEIAYENWLNMKNPTDSSHWKSGVFAFTKQISTKVES